MSAKKKPAPMSVNVSALVEERYPKDAYVFLKEVRSTTGLGRVRTADALALGLWPSRGLELEGFEFKISRSDWQRELADQAKAEEIHRFCDRWWLAVGSADIVREGELPQSWGLLVPNTAGDAMEVRRPAPKLTPMPWTREFMAAFLRSGRDTWGRPTEWAIGAAVTKALADNRERKHGEMARVEARLREERAARETFEQAAGIQIDIWPHGPERTGAAVRWFLDGGSANMRAEAEKIRYRLTELLKSVDAVLAVPPAETDREATG